MGKHGVSLTKLSRELGVAQKTLRAVLKRKVVPPRYEYSIGFLMYHWPMSSAVAKNQLEDLQREQKAA